MNVAGGKRCSVTLGSRALNQFKPIVPNDELDIIQGSPHVEDEDDEDFPFVLNAPNDSGKKNVKRPRQAPFLLTKRQSCARVDRTTSCVVISLEAADSRSATMQDLQGKGDSLGDTKRPTLPVLATPRCSTPPRIRRDPLCLNV